MMCFRVWRGFFGGEEGGWTSDGKGAVDVVPPAAVDAGVADCDEEADGEEELGDAGEVEGFGVCEDGHFGEAGRGE